MKTTSDRTKKLLALQAAMTGNVELLLHLKAQLGRPYTDQELAVIHRQWQAINPLATPTDSLKMFGLYAPVEGKAYEVTDLGNGFYLFW